MLTTTSSYEKIRLLKVQARDWHTLGRIAKKEGASLPWLLQFYHIAEASTDLLLPSLFLSIEYLMVLSNDQLLRTKNHTASSTKRKLL